MTKYPLTKKTLVISSWAPPMKGASPRFFYNIFSQLDPVSFIIFTDHKARNAETEHKRLECLYFYFNDPATTPLPLQSTSMVIRTAAKFLSFCTAVATGLYIIRSQKIELLLGTADNGRALILTFVLSILSRRPYVLYFLDLYRWNQLGVIWDLWANIFEPILFQYAKSIFVMGEGHQKFYERKYKRRFPYVIIRNCPQAALTPKRTKNKSAPYTILYSGNIYWPQERAIRNLIRAITKTPIDVRLLLYTPQRLARFESEYEHNPRIVFSSASWPEIAATQSGVDIVFLPLSFNTKTPEVIEMAIPGKTAEYLASGTPILVHAPPYAFLTTYANEKKFAHVVASEEISELERGISILLFDTSYARELTVNAKKLLKQEYDVLENALRLKEAIDQL